MLGVLGVWSIRVEEYWVDQKEKSSDIYKACVHWLVCRFQNLNLNNPANLGRIGEIEISMESGGHASHDYDVCACACKLAPTLAGMHSIFWRA